MFGWRLEKGSAPLWLRALSPVISIIVTFLLTTVLLALARANPFAAFYAMLIEPLSAPVSALEVLVKATPLLLTGMAVVFAFQSGYYNIGAEGQLYAGALAAAWIGQLPVAHLLPAPLVIALMLAGGVAAGVLWGGGPLGPGCGGDRADACWGVRCGDAVGARPRASAPPPRRGRGGDDAPAQHGHTLSHQRHSQCVLARPGDELAAVAAHRGGISGDRAGVARASRILLLRRPH